MGGGIHANYVCKNVKNVKNPMNYLDVLLTTVKQRQMLVVHPFGLKMFKIPKKDVTLGRR